MSDKDICPKSTTMLWFSIGSQIQSRQHGSRCWDGGGRRDARVGYDDKLGDADRDTDVVEHHTNTTTPCSTLKHATKRYNTLQHTTTRCNTLQRTATHCCEPSTREVQQERDSTEAIRRHKVVHQHKSQSLQAELVKILPWFHAALTEICQWSHLKASRGTTMVLKGIKRNNEKGHKKV